MRKCITTANLHQVVITMVDGTTSLGLWMKQVIFLLLT